MKAISLWQPWASLIACGAKPYETRHWAPPRALIGQTIAIHAAKRVDKDAIPFAEELLYSQHQPGGFELADRLTATMQDTPPELLGTFGMATYPVGCIVCTARLDAAFFLGGPVEGSAFPAASVIGCMTSRTMPACYTVLYDNFGDYAPGRWAWLLSDVRVVTPPIAMVGQQGFFDLPQGWMISTEAQHE
jgi:hypothetical protein